MSMSESIMIQAGALSKRYGETQALDKVDLEVPAGSILGVLGPNGAGKTTGVRILTTLTAPDSGWARVAGQDATLDEALSGRQNLVMIGQLSRLRRAEARRRAAELLGLFELGDAANRIGKGYSGGMRR